MPEDTDELPVPDGMTARHALDREGNPIVVFYTGRFAAEYDANDVRELIEVLNGWLDGHSPKRNSRRD